MPNLHEGMSPTEVKATTGSPSSQQRQGEMLGLAWTNRAISVGGMDRTDAYALFEDDKLISWGTGEVRCEVLKVDQYDRQVARHELDGEVLSQWLVANGL